MAIYNEILAARYNRFLQKLLSMKGPASMNQLAPELMPSIMISSGVENRYLEGWEKFALVADQTSGVGNTAFVRLRNPTGSGVVAVVESCIISTGATDTISFQLGAATADFVSVATVRESLDSRSRPLPTCIFSAANAQAALNVVGKYILLGSTNFQLINDENQEWPLLPGDAYQWQNATASTRMIVSIVWRERPLEDSELR